LCPEWVRVTSKQCRKAEPNRPMKQRQPLRR
jgi:hypothetical protein